jgi:hypothetical protein
VAKIKGSRRGVLPGVCAPGFLLVLVV